MNTTRLQSGISWMARIILSIVCLASICMIGVFLAFLWTPFSSVDFPPTWYLGLSVVLAVADVAAICYIAFSAVRALLQRSAFMRAAWPAVSLVLLLGVSHATALYAYSEIPPWDFKSSLVGDLSRAPAGSISSDCSGAQGERVPFTQLESIARYDYAVRRGMLREVIAHDWNAWIESVSSHSQFGGPEQRVVSLVLRDPYSADSVMDSSRQALIDAFYFVPEDIEKLSVGQEVLLCGRILDVSNWIPGTLIMDMNRITLNPRMPGNMATAVDVPPDLLVDYESNGCASGYRCPEFKVTIRANGSVTYEGLNGEQSEEGVKHGQASQRRLAELAWVLEKAGFFALNGQPERIEGDPAGWTVLYARMNGHSKTIALPWGSGPWPDNVGLYIGKIQEASGLEKWVSLVK
jgi:hypothetical protein